jgi:hypothetical protein
LRYKDRPGSDGILSIQEAAEALEDKSEKSAAYLLRLMERFEMCFSLEEEARQPTRWLIPAALSPYQPQGLGKQWQGTSAVRLRYDYGSPVAEGVIPRFIVLTHPLKGEHVWRNGVVLRDGEAAAVVRRSEKGSLIEVAALGPDAQRLRLLETIQGTMDRINADLPGKRPTIEKELDGVPGEYRSLADLRAAEIAKKPIVVGTTPPPVLVEATPQLDRVSEKEWRDAEPKVLKTFLSYSHDDRAHKNVFATNLAVMQNRGLISSWQDGMIRPGDDWRRAINEQLERMDLFIGLLTTNFLASDFIQRVELKAARQRLREREKRDFLFVLIVVDDNLSLNFDLAQYQLLLPGHKSISKHPNRRAFFNQAQRDIEELIKTFRFRYDEPVDRRLMEGIDPAPPPRGTVGVTYIVQGDYVSGGKQVTDSHNINIGGNVINNQVAQNLTNSTNMIQQQAPGERKDLLDQLRKDVEQLIKQLPPEKKDEAPHVAESLEMLVKQATSDKPNRKWYSLSAEGLLDASKWAKAFAGNIFGTVGQIGKLIWPDFSLPRKEEPQSPESQRG